MGAVELEIQLEESGVVEIDPTRMVHWAAFRVLKNEDMPSSGNGQLQPSTSCERQSAVLNGQYRLRAQLAALYPVVQLVFLYCSSKARLLSRFSMQHE